MSVLLDEIIVARKAKAIEYEEYLKRIAALAKQVEAGHGDEMPGELDTPGKRALYNNLREGVQGQAAVADDRGTDSVGGDPVLNLALRIDQTVRKTRPDEWRGHRPKENTIKRALLPLLDGNEEEVERIFRILKANKEY